MEAKEAFGIINQIAEKYDQPPLTLSGYLHNASDREVGPESNQRSIEWLNTTLGESDASYLLRIWSEFNG
ncbi:MAG: hypothetical protein Q8Q65_04395 [bacterium]|nr:hypothetical protein [bacterium]